MFEAGIKGEGWIEEEDKDMYWSEYELNVQDRGLWSHLFTAHQGECASSNGALEANQTVAQT